MRATTVQTTIFPTQQRVIRPLRAMTVCAGTMCRIVQTTGRAIAAPPSHPMWRTPDAAELASLLPARRRERLMHQGRLAPRR